MKKLISFAVFIVMTLLVSSQNNNDLAIKANKAYQGGQYPLAIQLYQKVVGNGYESAPLFYNLGNAYFRNNELPSAILYYEKALKLEPNQSDILHNISVANSRITDKVELIPDLFYKRWWTAALNTLSIESLALFLILILSAAFLSTAVYLTSRKLFIRKFSFWTGIVLFAVFFLALAGAQQKEHLLKSHHEAIVFTPTVSVKSSPDMASADLFVIHEGIKVVLLDQIGEWQEIRIANGSIGWLKTADIRLI